jgi:GAF domain-containing protein
MPTLRDRAGRPAGPDRHDASARIQLLHALGLAEDQPIAELDDLARQLAHETADRTSRPYGFYGFVNIVKGDHQFFAGLYIPADPDIGQTPPASIPPISAAARIMPLNEGWCMRVLDRRLALPLRHVNDMPRWSNPAIAKLGAQTYLGAPLLDPGTGTVFGTVAVVGTTQTDWALEDVQFIKGYADRVLEIIAALPNGNSAGRR